MIGRTARTRSKPGEDGKQAPRKNRYGDAPTGSLAFGHGKQEAKGNEEEEGKEKLDRGRPPAQRRKGSAKEPGRRGLWRPRVSIKAGRGDERRQQGLPPRLFLRVRRLVRRNVPVPVDQDAPDEFLRFRKRRDAAVLLHAAGPGIVGRQGQLHGAEALQLVHQILGTGIDIGPGIEGVDESQLFLGMGHDLHGPLGAYG